jgi:nucleotidyltransferase/DNA polymerase involved in DNA repair
MATAKAPTRILHVDSDSFFASCEIALHLEWQGRPVWVGGGHERRRLSRALQRNLAL